MQTSDVSPLNPALKAALSSLDLDLESELSRYRRLKNKNSTHSGSNPVVIPVESLDLREIVGLVHQPDGDLSTNQTEEMSPPDDYLESSARLLRSLAENNLLVNQERILLNPVKTPWGISSLLMLFLGASLLGLAFIPQEIWAKVFSVQSLLVDRSNPDVNISNSESLDKPNTLDNVDLSQSEFLRLNPNNLSTLQVENNEQNDNIPTRKSPTDSKIDSVDTGINSKPQSTPNQDLATALLSPVLNQIQPQAQSETDTYSDSAFVSFADYQGDRTLRVARQIIKDAYLVQFPTGKKIQFGAFGNQEDANRLAKNLQSRGISASVYDPKD
jgi:hypothetical protein